ncbi:uncharacterized protein [Gossypium hirsutum]|uniref:Uncharacterized protein isoform X2 n=1 Tax=Gossypium hirsutum TaxID=3635 RepID=A0ABM3BZS0_GOSHI|nr:uncharacterized protein LOC107936969 isoform X2 [Gossypium hirsutum]
MPFLFDDIEIPCFRYLFEIYRCGPRKYCFGSSFQIYGCRCGCSCWMLWERKKFWFCKISPAMASLFTVNYFIIHILYYIDSSQIDTLFPSSYCTVLAFRDIAPWAPTHILIIPKAKDGLTGLCKVSLFRLPASHINPRYLSLQSQVNFLQSLSTISAVGKCYPSRTSSGNVCRSNERGKYRKFIFTCMSPFSLLFLHNTINELNIQEQAQVTSVDQMRGGNIESLAAIQWTRMLAHTLSQNSDPKFRNSKFLQFVSKMSRGELIIDDNQVKPASENWATEYQQQYNGGASWADEFAHDEVFRGPDDWANEFGAERLQQESVDDQWVNEFSKLHVDDWAEEIGRQAGEGALGDSSSDNWANSYDEFLSGRTLQGVSMYFLI